MQINEVRMTIRLPRWAADYLDAAGKENFTSRNAEIVRSIRERMQTATGVQFADQAPVAADHAAALPGGSTVNS